MNGLALRVEEKLLAFRTELPSPPFCVPAHLPTM